MHLSKHEKICRHCGQPFLPELRNRARQDYCYKPACRKARKARSHRRWRGRNPDYFKGESNVERVRQWRDRNPGYWRRRKANPKPTNSKVAVASSQAKNDQHHSAHPLQDRVPPLQDSIEQNPLILGLVARVCGCTLQDCVANPNEPKKKEGKEIAKMALDASPHFLTNQLSADLLKILQLIDRNGPFLTGKARFYYSVRIALLSKNS